MVQSKIGSVKNYCVKIDCKLTFNYHIDEIYMKAGQKMNALSKIVPYMNNNKLFLINVL